MCSPLWTAARYAVDLLADDRVFQFPCIAAATHMSEKRVPHCRVTEPHVKLVDVTVFAQSKYRRFDPGIWPL